jgi:hypothetical protein
MLLSFESFHSSHITRHVAPWLVIEISAEAPLAMTRDVDRRYLPKSARQDDQCSWHQGLATLRDKPTLNG